MLGYPKTVGDRNRLHFGKNCYSGVAFFRLAAVPMLLIAAGHLLPDAFFVNFLEVSFRHIETNDDWVKNTKGQYILYDFIGDLGKSKHKDVKIENIFRSFDLASKIYVYKGIGFNMGAMLAAIASITDTVNKAHYHLFPDQWTDVDKDGKPTGNKNAPDMKKAPIKEKAKTKKE